MAADSRMNPRTATELLTLAALWGASFLFMRLGAGEFGPVMLSFLRVLIAALTLLPILVWSGHLAALRQHWKPIVMVGIINSALPFLAYSYAVLSVTGGLASVFNATSPLWGALIAWWWLGDRLTRWRVLGLVIGFAGVLGLALSNVNQPAAFKPGGNGWAVVACVAATFLYGLAASATKRFLTGVPPMAVATGSQLGASAFLLLPALFFIPPAMPSAGAWAGAVLLGALCTGIAYILYFRLLAAMGPKAITVTFLIPLFAVVWGGIFLGETVTLAMVIGCTVILVGTSLTTGLVGPRTRPASAPAVRSPP
jgi:drug/metabolite transporter (DMT)-like permease